MTATIGMTWMSLQTIEKSSAAIDSQRWPAVAKVPSGPLCTASGVVADRLLRRAAARLALRLVYPDGSVIGAADPTAPTMVIHQPVALARRIGRYGLIGFGESYMAGEWSCNESSQDLAQLLTVSPDRWPTWCPARCNGCDRSARRFGPVGAAPAGIRRGATSPSTRTCRTSCSPNSSTRP